MDPQVSQETQSQPWYAAWRAIWIAQYELLQSMDIYGGNCAPYEAGARGRFCECVGR